MCVLVFLQLQRLKNWRGAIGVFCTERWHLCHALVLCKCILNLSLGLLNYHFVLIFRLRIKHYIAQRF